MSVAAIAIVAGHAWNETAMQSGPLVVTASGAAACTLLAVSHVARNVFAILAAVVAAYISLAIAATFDTALGYPRSYSSAAGEMILRLSALWPFVAAAVVLGAVVAWIAKPRHGRLWLLIVFVLAAGQYAMSLRYIAPEWQEWLKTVAAAAIVGAAAVCAFWLIARRAFTVKLSPGRTVSGDP